jgi:peroxiredoxin (alkyl hydroperoxide reductase subunit C)
VVFYPADFTFVCPTELGDIADHYEELQKMGVEVFSVSTDTHFTHKAWHDASETIKKIKFPMIGDPTGVISRNFNVMIEEEGLALRGTFIINPEGLALRVRKLLLKKNLKLEKNYKLFQEMRAL